MVDGYKNREVVFGEFGTDILSDPERSEYLLNGTITVSSIEPFYERRRIKERFTSNKKINRFGIEKLLKSKFYRRELAIDGVPITYFLNMEYGLVSVIGFSDNTIHVSCNNPKFYSYLTAHLEELGCKYELFENFIRINLNKIK